MTGGKIAYMIVQGRVMRQKLKDYCDKGEYGNSIPEFTEDDYHDMYYIVQEFVSLLQNKDWQ